MKTGKRKIKPVAGPATSTAGGDPFGSGIELVSVWLSECSFKDFGFNRAVQEGDQHAEVGGDQVDVGHEGEVWFDEKGTDAIVRLTVTVKPEMQPSFEAKVAYVGYYRSTAAPNIPLETFAWTNGMAYLVPFVREKLAALTQSSYYEPVYLQPFNVFPWTEAEPAGPKAAESATNVQAP